MRTNEQWEEKVLPKILQGLSPRLRRDLEQYPNPNPPTLGGYYIHGPNGSGKTILAGHIYIAAQRERYFKALPGSYRFINTYDFFEDLKRSFDNPEIDEHAVMARYSSDAFLVLDDLGATKFTEWSLSQIQILINNRYEMLLPTVFTSNFSLEELGEVLGDDRIPSRIKRMCKVIKLKVK